MNLSEIVTTVFTSDETAAYLRVSREAVERLASLGHLPGRQIEGEWRFLRPALDDWLRGDPSPSSPSDGGGGKANVLSSREALLEHHGRLAHDETLLPMLEQIYAERGRPEVDLDSSR